MKNTITRSICCIPSLIAGFGLVALSASAQDVTTPTPELMQKAEESLARLKKEAEQLTQVVIAKDKSIEARIDKIVEHTATLRDSTDTRSRVTQSKEDLIEALTRSIQFYEREREKRFKELYAGNTSVPREELDKQVDALGERTTKRITQIVALSNSFTDNSDFQYYTGRYEDRRIKRTETTEYRRHASSANRGARTREEISTSMRKAADDGDRRAKALEDKLRVTTDPARKAILEKEIAKERAAALKLRTEATAVLTGESTVSVTTGPAGTTAVSSRTIIALRNLIADEVTALRRETQELREAAARRDRALAKLAAGQRQMDGLKEKQNAPAPIQP